MIGLVEEMLNPPDAKDTNIEIQKQEIKLEEIAKSAIDDLCKLASLKEQTITLEAKSLPPIVGDRQRSNRYSTTS